MADVFRASNLVDEEGVQTRWNLRPSGFVILLRSNPAHRGNLVHLEFLDGSLHDFLPGLFDFPLARMLHRNAVRVSRHIIADQLRAAPAWLIQHSPQSVLAVCHGDSSDCLPTCSSEQTSYSLSYHAELGLSFAKTLHSERLFTEEETDWF